MTLPDVVAVTALPDHRLQLRFDDGVEGKVDVTAIVTFEGVFEPLADPAYFSQVEVAEEAGTVVWPNGADLDPLALYAHATGRSIEDLLEAEDALTG